MQVDDAMIFALKPMSTAPTRTFCGQRCREANQ